MRTLIIDNESTLLGKLRQLVPGEKVIKKWDEICPNSTAGYDLIILSGGSQLSVEGDEKGLKPEMDLVSPTKIPVVGICYGCEVIVKTFGGTLEKMPEREKGIFEIKVIHDEDIFGGKDTLNVYENHKWRIKTLPDNFIILAESDYGIEAIRHVSLPIYGFQFHPENFAEQTEGDEAFIRLFNTIVGR